MARDMLLGKEQSLIFLVILRSFTIERGSIQHWAIAHQLNLSNTTDSWLSKVCNKLGQDQLADMLKPCNHML